MEIDWGTVIAIAGINLTLGGIMIGFIIWAFSKLDNDINSVSDRLDGWIKHSIAINAEQSKRTDQLYQMFIDLLNVRREK